MFVQSFYLRLAALVSNMNPKSRIQMQHYQDETLTKNVNNPLTLIG